MNRLNPLYIVGLFITILCISFYLLTMQKEEFSNKNIEYLDINKNAIDYKSFKSTCITTLIPPLRSSPKANC